MRDRRGRATIESVVRTPRLACRAGAPLAAALVWCALLLLPGSAIAEFGYLGQWGSSGTGNAQFQAPMGLDVDPVSGDVYVADCQLDRVKEFQPDGTFVRQWGTHGTGDGAFDCPRDVASDGTHVYVVDFYNNRVQRFSTAGAYQLQWDNAAGGAFDEPVGVAADGTNVFVVDTGPTSAPAPRLQRFSTTGVPLGMIGSAGAGAGQYDTPIGVAIASTGGPVVSDQGNHRIVTFTSLWAPGPVWGSLGPGNGQFGALQQGVDADAAGNVWVADWENNRIQRFDGAGAFLGTWGTSGSGDLNFNGPMDVAAGPSADGTVYVADAGNDRVVKYGPGALPTVTTGDATGVTWVVGTLNGTVNPRGTATSYRFQYGPDANYGSTTALTAAGAGTADVAATGAMVGLMADRTYHYRLVAERGGQVVARGEDRTLHTWPDPGGATNCLPRYGHTVGVVGVCADQLTYAAGRWTATGNVVLDGGVAVSGPVVINDGLQEITSTGSVTVSVQRGTPVTVGSGSLIVNGAGMTDPTSGRSGLGLLTIQNPLTITLANVPFVPLLSNYLDPADGGGVILAARPSFDLLGPLAGATLPTGSFALGIHRTASGPFRVLGGSVKWDKIEISSTWELGFSVSYAEGPPAQLQVGGKLKAPFLPGGTGAEITGAFSGSSLDQLTVKVSLPGGFPIGSTGIIADTFGGSLKGLAGGANNPLMISAIVGGGWTKTPAPEPFNWILHIKDVTLTLDTSGAGSLSGEVDVVDGEGRLVKGTAAFTLRLFPSFLASGSFAATFNAVAVSANLGLTAALNTSHFTAQGGLSGSVLGINVGSGNAVLSDKGVGATTRVCALWWCKWIGAGLTWTKVASWPPSVDWIGSDVQQYVTLTASAARVGARSSATTRAFRVERGRPFLYVEARGSETDAFELVSPTGAVYRPGSRRKDAYSQTLDGVTAQVVYGPTPGTWRLRSRTERRTTFRIEAIRELGRVRAGRVSPTSSRSRRLPARTKRIRVTWRHTGYLPPSTRLALYTAATGKAPGKVLKTGLPATGATAVTVTKLRHGANHLYLVPKAEGIQFDLIRFPRPTWRR